MSKLYTLLVDGKAVDYSSKKTAVKHGDNSGHAYQVMSPAGKIVHAVQAEEPESKLTRSIAYPGNYSIVMVPFARELADAFGGLEFHSENTAGLTRNVFVTGPVKRVDEFMALLNQESIEVMDALHEWQKANAEERRGLTDMQKYLQHREFITSYGARVARRVRKDRKS